ncbi:MAG: glycoside hydrolase family 15 protein [Gemmatimonadaceae bacterium]
MQLSPTQKRQSSLDLALIGNGTVSALVNSRADIVWSCFPNFGGDPVFCSLLAPRGPAELGVFSIELVGGQRAEQAYLQDTPILVTKCTDAKGGGIRITDWAPRYEDGPRVVAPPVLVRKIEPMGGKARVVVRLRPAQDYGCAGIHPLVADGSIRYAGEKTALQLRTNALIDAVLSEAEISIAEPITLTFGLDEALGIPEASRWGDVRRTQDYWLKWVASLDVPHEWRDAVVRAAISLRLNVFERTGAIVAAMTTSIPEAPDTQRTWDYRYCWLRDAYFVAAALNSLGDAKISGRFLDFVLKASRDSTKPLKPLYGIDLKGIPPEHFAKCLEGYRGMGPIRVGNEASAQIQHDAYGEVILAAQPLFDEVFPEGATAHDLFTRLEGFGEQAARLFAAPDAGLWELRGIKRVHTFSSVMCWAACDRLADYAVTLGLEERARFWRDRAAAIHAEICRRSWSEPRGAFTATMEGESLDASLLLMAKLGFLAADDPRYIATVEAIEKDLRHGDFIYRYVEKDHLGRPENAFLVCTFWYIEALAALGRTDEARSLFDKVLSCRNRHGLLAEDIDPVTLEQWGNFVQTYSMAGIIDCAVALAGGQP